MRVALVEPNLTGHRATYLKHYIESFIDAGHTVFVLCPESNELMKGFPRSLIDQVNFIQFELQRKGYPFFATTLNSLRYWKSASRKIKESMKEVDSVFFMSLDTFNATFYNALTILNIKLHKYLNRFIPRFIDSVFPFQWGGIYLTPNPDHSHIFYSKNNFLIGILESTTNFSDESLNRKIVQIPDITDITIERRQSDLEKQIFERANGRTIVSLLGRIHKRKGVLTLLETAERMKNSDYFFLFAGEPAMNSFSMEEQEKVDQIKKENPGNCFFHFERVEDGHEFNSLVRVSDVLFAAYLNFPFSSNLLTKASCFKKPVIVSDIGFMKEAVEKYKMGVAIEERSVSDCISAIKEIEDSFSIDEALFDKYYCLNSVDRIDEVVREFQNKLSAK